MNGDLRSLYQEVVIDHGRHPRNFRKLDNATSTADGVNPVCGDEITLYIKLSEGSIQDIAFQGVGCAISQASASLMTMALKGKNQAEALALFGQMHAMLTERPVGDVPPEELGKLAVLSGVWEFPLRVKCATLAWHTMRSALGSSGDRVSTESTHP